LPTLGRRLLSLALICVAWEASAQPRSTTPQLPGDLTAALRRSGCRVPAAPTAFGRDTLAAIEHVAYRATVRTASVTDWVIVCERESRREIYIYASPVRPASQPLLRLPIAWDATGDGCEGWIGVADTTWVRAAFAHAIRQRRPVDLDSQEKQMPMHSGILDGMCEGDGALMRYWTGRRWVTLQSHWDGS
jgi:hypothetical protein